MTRGNPPNGRGKRPRGHDSGRHLTNDDGPTQHDLVDGPTSIDGPKVRDIMLDRGEPNIEGAHVTAQIEPHDTISNEVRLGHTPAPDLVDDAVAAALTALTSSLLAGPLLTFEGKAGERFGGDVDRLGTTPHFVIRIGDSSLGDHWPKGALLAFAVDAAPQPGDVVLVRSKRTKQLGLRRATGSAWAPLVAWQPAYAVGGEWLAMARLRAVLPRT